jgi:hypothetical protein
VRRIYEDLHSSHVTALFADCALSFVLPEGATLEDLPGALLLSALARQSQST